ncbi:hypothetical protein HWV62_19673 [Athelia sp. TMB]|nr:hypothetical protein HWV62_19673 [Athelia sp. TMB]
MGGKIDCYLDCTSFYGYLAYKHLREQRATLRTHGIEVEFHPVFLGGINVLSGNKPPWSLPAKAVYGAFDNARAQAYFGVHDITTPDFFPILSILPQRAMLYVKDTFSNEKFEDVYGAVFRATWVAPHRDLSKVDVLQTFLSEHFTPTETAAILAAAASPAYKQKLSDVTKRVVEEQGAFGCPWFWVVNGAGKGEPFFGSDRFHFMWAFLGLPWEDVKLLPKDAKAHL